MGERSLDTSGGGQCPGFGGLQGYPEEGGAAQGEPSYSKSSPQVSHLVSSAVSSSSGGICAQKRAHSAAEGTRSARRTAAARMRAATEGTKLRRMVSCVSWSEARLGKRGAFAPWNRQRRRVRGTHPLPWCRKGSESVLLHADPRSRVHLKATALLYRATHKMRRRPSLAMPVGRER